MRYIFGILLLQAISMQALCDETVQTGIESLQQYAARDIGDLSVDDFVQIADYFGDMVVQTRELEDSVAVLFQLLDSAEDFRRLCRSKIRALERATMDDETRLEKLYRSDLWHDINYSLSAFGYWESWVLLGIAGNKSGNDDQAGWLNRAESGFQSSSVHILYPGVVYGSWLGMGYVARKRGDEELASQRFERLVQALINDPSNPAREVAETELSLMAIRRGEREIDETGQAPPLTRLNSVIYIEEAFMLLQQQRETGTGGIAAATRLKQLIAGGYLDDSLVTRILSYLGEIVGHDLGLFSLCVDAEYAYGYERYNTTVLKYREFEEKGGPHKLISVPILQYHYTVALLKIGQFRAAQEELEKLANKSQMPDQVVAALPGLSLRVAQALYDQRDDVPNRARLLDAATNLIDLNPGDPATSIAHLLLSRLTLDPVRARHHLDQARLDSKLKKSIALSQVNKAIAGFNLSLTARDVAAQRQYAQETLQNLDELSRQIRTEQWARAVSIQMQTVLGKDLLIVLAEIEELYLEQDLDPPVQLQPDVLRLLMWSKLRLLDKLDRKQLLLFIEQISVPGVEGFVQRLIYQFLLEKEELGQLLLLPEMLEAFYPALAGKTQDQRQLRLLEIRVRAASDQPEKAFLLAKKMTQEFAGSGDAWIAYASSAEAVGELLTAERAWGKIEDSVPIGAPRWRSAVFRRIILLAVLGDRNTELCDLVHTAQQYRHLVTAQERSDLENRATQHHCL